MKIMSIGFTQKSAEHFFTLLQNKGVTTLYDVRLNNRSQLSGFAKRDDLAYFLRQLAGIDYQHLPELAPTDELLKSYRKKQISWPQYEARFMALMQQRRIERLLSPEQMDSGCLLCSEHQPHLCHRKLVLEYLNRCWDSCFEVEHLV